LVGCLQWHLLVDVAPEGVTSDAERMARIVSASDDKYKDAALRIATKWVTDGMPCHSLQCHILLVVLG
jgi:hypothetical protein